MSSAIISLVTVYMPSGTRFFSDQQSELFPTFVKQLAGPVKITDALPERSSGIPQAQRVTIPFSNTLRTATTPTVSYLFTLDDLYGVRVHAENYDLDDGKTIISIDGTILDFGALNDELAEAIVESLDADGLDTSLPQNTILEAFPNSDLTSLRDASASVRVPFGIMPKVDLGLCQANVLTCTFVIAASADADKYFYADDTSVPDTLTQNGDRLIYDMFLATAGARVGMSLWDGTTLLHATAAVDQNGLSNHPATDLSAYAQLKWYRRDIPLPAALIGKTLTTYLVACENDTAGTYIAYIANAAIVDAYGNVRVSIFNENITPTYNVDTPFLRLPVASTATITKTTIWDFGAIRLPAITNFGLSFSGAGALTYANPDRYNFTTLTAEIWFKTSSATGDPVLMGRTWTGGHGWTLRLNSITGGLLTTIATSAGGGASATVGVFTDNIWHHAALSINVATSTLKVYGDGLLLTTTLYGGTFTTGGGTFSSGAALLTGGALTGSLTEARIWNRVLSDHEISFHYDALKTGYESGLMGYWPMNENTGATAHDNSPNGNDATLTGHTWVAGPTATQMVPNVINELYRDGGVVPRDQWSPIAWGSFLLAQFLSAPRSPAGRLPHIQADLISREFGRNPANVIMFLLTDINKYGIAKTIDTDSFKLFTAQYASLLNPKGYKIDGGLNVSKPFRDILRELLLHGAVLSKTTNNNYAGRVDLANFALTFVGASAQFIAIGARADLSFTSNIFTIEFWFKATDTTTAMGVLRKRVAGSAEEYAIWTSAGGTLEFRAWNSTGVTVVYQVNTTYDTLWHHFAWICDGANTFLLKDGVQVATAAKGGASMANTTAPFELGRSRDNAGAGIAYMNGLLDEMRIWNVARTQQQINDNYQIELTAMPASLVMYVTFNEYGSGGVYDLAAGLWYTISGGATWSTEAAVTWDDPTLDLGDGDWDSTAWGNARLTAEHIEPLAQRVTSLTLRGAQDPGFIGNPVFNYKSFRTIAGDKGVTTTEDKPYIGDWDTLDHEVDYQTYRRFYARRSIEVKVYRSARYLQTKQLLTLHAPNRPNLDGNRYELSSRAIAAEDLNFLLLGWNVRPYQFANGTGQARPVVAVLTDYTQTLPDMPTAFSTGTNTYTISAAGVVTVTVPVTATASSTPNVTALVFKMTDASGVPLKTQSIPTLPSSTISVFFDGLPTGTAFYYRVYAFAGLNKANFQEGINAVLGPVTTGSTPGAPSNATSLASTSKPGQAILTWTNPTNIDLAAIEIHRSTSNSFIDNTTKIDQMAKVGDAAGVSSKYIDSSGVYGTTYFYSVRAKNSSGQVSSFATSVSVKIPPTTTIDRQDMNSTLLTGGNLNGGTRRVMTFTISPALAVTPGLSVDVADTPLASAATLVGPWEQRTNLVSAWQYNADPSNILNMGNLTLWWWVLLVISLSVFSMIPGGFL